MNKIKTFEDAFAALNLKPESIIDFSAAPEKHRKALEAHYKLVIIAEALNEGWKPNWEDFNENKYTPWFTHKAGFGLSCYDYDGWDAGTNVGSRLCLKTSELAEYAGKQFEELYRDYLTL